MRRGLLVISVVALTFGLSAVAARIGDARDERPPPRPISLPDRVPEPEPEAAFVGVLVAPESVDIALKVDGQIARIDARVGDKVLPGRALVALSSAVLGQEVRISVALLAGTQERLRRNQALYDAQVLSAAELEQTRHEALVASARADRARAALAEGTVRAPFEGVVVAKYVDKGAYVKAGQPILRIVGTGPVRIRFAVPERDAPSIAPGTRLVARLEPEEVVLDAEVEAVSSEVEPASLMVFAEARVDARASNPRLVGRLVKLSRTAAQTNASRSLSE